MANTGRIAFAAAALLAGTYFTTVTPSPAFAAIDLGNVVIAQEGWRYNLTLMREQAKTNAAKAAQYQDYLTRNKITDDYIVAYAAAVAAKFGTGASSAGNTGGSFTPDPILNGIEISDSGWRYNLTIMREQAKTNAAKAAQYQDYLTRNKITDAYIVAYAAAVAAKYGSSSGSPGGSTGGGNSGGGSAGGGNSGGSFTPDPILNGIEISDSGWRYNLTIMREQAKTNAAKAAQYQDYLTRNKITDAYIVAYAAAVAAKYGSGSPGAKPGGGNTGGGSAGGGAGGNGGAFVQDPILNGIEVINSGWRYNLTILKNLGQYSTAKQAEYEYYRDRNKVTDAYVDAYAAAVANKYNPDDVGKNIKVSPKPDFTIYRGFRYYGMPSLANCGLSEDIRILYHQELFGGASMTTPNIPHLKNNVVPNLLKRDVTYVMIDIEHWDAVNEMDKLITVIRTLKEGVRAAGNTKMQFGYYMLVPERNYLAPTTKSYRPDRWVTWMETNEKMRRLAAEVDVIFPSLYTPAENREHWLEYARTNIAEARKYGKKVIPVLWPQYHDTTPGIGTTYMPINFWNIQLKEIYNLADDMVIWGSVAFQSKGWGTWDKNREWWEVTRAFAKQYSDVPQSNSCQD